MDSQNKTTRQRLEMEVFGFVMPLPLPDGAVDLFRLVQDRPELAVSCLEGIVAGKLRHELSPDFKTAKWAFEQKVELQNRNRLYGGHWLWFGFPLIQFAGDQQSLIAPLWLWPVNLNAPSENREGWLLKSNSDHTPKWNPCLDHLFREKLGWEEPVSWWEATRRNMDSLDALSELVHMLTDKLGLESSSQSVSISPWSERAVQSDIDTGGNLIWSGLIGIFPPSFPVAGTHVEKSVSTTDSLTHTFGMMERDPWQETAFQVACRNRGALIQGKADSGKTTLLTDFVLHALSEGKSCLILSDRMESLRSLQETFAELGLKDLTLLLHQLKEEPALVLQLLRGAARKKKETSFAANQYDQRLKTLLQQRDTLDRAYLAANKKILGLYSWTQVAGLYLAASRLESKALLGSQLNAQDFELGFERYQLLREKLDYSQALFHEIKTLNHPLTVLNAGIFVHQEKEEAEDFILSKVSEISEAASALQHRFILEQNDYGDRLVDSYEQFYRQMNDQILSLQEKLHNYRQLYGQDPLESTRTTLRLYARFSEKFRQTLKAKDDLALGYRELEETLRRYPNFHHDFLPTSERHLLGRLTTNLEQLHEQLRSWREQLGLSVQDELARLSSKTVHEDLPGHGGIGELENELALLVEALNDSGLLQLPLENKHLTVPRQQRFLEEILEKLDRLRFNMRDFDRFYEWQRYWFGLPAEARRIITALVKVKPDNWSAAFSSWYLHHQLLQTADPYLPVVASDLSSFVEGIQQWRTQLIDRIKDHWADQRAGTLQQLKKNQKPLYEFLQTKKEGTGSLSVDAFAEYLPDFFPILMSAPASDYTFLDPERKFDLILVDDAHNLSPDLFPIWESRGRKMILLQNQDFGNTDIVAWVRRRVWPQLSLAGSYTADLQEIQLEEVGGRYNNRQAINDEEAQRVLGLLNDVEETPQRTLPRVSIVCLTRPQRNLLLQYLDRIKRQRLAGVEKIQQLERNGLGVYVPEEMHGLKTDVLIVSCTFGRTGAADQLTSDVYWLDQHERGGLVSLLRSRALQRIQLVYSIPEDDLYRMARDPSDGNSVQLSRWLLELKEHEKGPFGPVTDEEPVHPLAAEIGWQLADQLRTDRFAFSVPFNQVHLPLTIAPHRREDPLVVLLNGFLAETEFTNYEWEHRHRQQLEGEGYRIFAAWATDWWKRPKDAAEALIALANTGAAEEE